MAQDLTRRALFQLVAGAAVAPALPVPVEQLPNPATGGLFNPHANVFAQFYGPGGVRDRIRLHTHAFTFVTPPVGITEL